jgi:hypothetical protein
LHMCATCVPHIVCVLPAVFLHDLSQTAWGCC